jgi:hypothetical protein
VCLIFININFIFEVITKGNTFQINIYVDSIIEFFFFFFLHYISKNEINRLKTKQKSEFKKKCLNNNNNNRTNHKIMKIRKLLVNSLIVILIFYSQYSLSSEIKMIKRKQIEHATASFLFIQYSNNNNYSISKNNNHNNQINLDTSVDYMGIIKNNTNHDSIMFDQSKNNYWALVLLLFPILAIFGNMLVVLSVIREKNLHTITNYLVASLALADLFVAAVVMPIAVYAIVILFFFFLLRYVTFII